jgi:hypothetical protein
MKVIEDFSLSLALKKWVMCVQVKVLIVKLGRDRKGFKGSS